MAQIIVNRTTQIAVDIDEVAKALAQCDLVKEVHHQPRFFNSFFQDLADLSAQQNAISLRVRFIMLEQGLQGYTIEALRKIVKIWDERQGS